MPDRPHLVHDGQPVTTDATLRRDLEASLIDQAHARIDRLADVVEALTGVVNWCVNRIEAQRRALTDGSATSSERGPSLRHSASPGSDKS